MPKGPRGEKRPADVKGAAIMVMRIAIGEETEEVDSAKSAGTGAGPQCAIRTGKVMLSRTVRVAPPSSSSRTRE